MLTFTLTGTVGRLRPEAEGTLIAVSSKRLVQNNVSPAVEWVVAIARDQLLRSKLERGLQVGEVVRIEGEIEPRRREIKGVAFYDVVFVARCFEKLGELASPAGEARP